VLLTAIGSTSTPPLGSAGRLVTVLPWIVNPASPCPSEPKAVIRPLSLTEVASGETTVFWMAGSAPRLTGVLLSGHSTAVMVPVVSDPVKPTTSAALLMALGLASEVRFPGSPGDPRNCRAGECRSRGQHAEGQVPQSYPNHPDSLCRDESQGAGCQPIYVAT
jgi:hypothetical protein